MALNATLLFDPQRLRRAVELQRQSYELLRWLADAVGRGFILFDTAHKYATARESAAAWIERHYADLPVDARPPRDDIPAFASFFTTYIENTFELVESPGRRLYSPDAHCFCPGCSWLVDVDRLQPKKLTRADKHRAHKLKRRAIETLALRLEIELEDSAADQLAADSALREETALLAYGVDLLHRVEGSKSGPATLALWRTFAWTPEGSPKKKFRLRSDDILQAEQGLADRIRALAGNRIAKPPAHSA